MDFAREDGNEEDDDESDVTTCDLEGQVGCLLFFEFCKTIGTLYFFG